MVRYLDYVKENSEILMKIFNDIIRYSKIDAGLIDVVSEKIPLNEFFFGMCSDYKKRVEEMEGYSVKIKFLPDRRYSDIVMKADREIFSAIFIKLVDNAIKYTMQGEIVINYLVDNDEIRFSISDTGLGIPDEEKEKIFRLFYQGDREFVSLHKGIGLGLNLVKQYVETMQGKLAFESISGIGTTFYVTFPVNLISYSKV